MILANLASLSNMLFELVHVANKFTKFDQQTYQWVVWLPWLLVLCPDLLIAPTLAVVVSQYLVPLTYVMTYYYHCHNVPFLLYMAIISQILFNK